MLQNIFMTQFQSSDDHSSSHMTAFWALGNQPAFMAICTIPGSLDCDLLCFLTETGVYLQFLMKTLHSKQ